MQPARPHPPPRRAQNGCEAAAGAGWQRGLSCVGAAGVGELQLGPPTGLCRPALSAPPPPVPPHATPAVRKAKTQKEAVKFSWLYDRPLQLHYSEMTTARTRGTGAATA